MQLVHLSSWLFYSCPVLLRDNILSKWGLRKTGACHLIPPFDGAKVILTLVNFTQWPTLSDVFPFNWVTKLRCVLLQHTVLPNIDSRGGAEVLSIAHHEQTMTVYTQTPLYLFDGSSDELETGEPRYFCISLATGKYGNGDSMMPFTFWMVAIPGALTYGCSV